MMNTILIRLLCHYRYLIDSRSDHELQVVQMKAFRNIISVIHSEEMVNVRSHEHLSVSF